MATLVQLPNKVTENIESFSVQEDATPIEPSDTFGGVGQIVIGLDDYPDAVKNIGGLVLSAGSRGKTSGHITNLSADNGKLNVTATSALVLYNVRRIAQPYQGTLQGYINYLSNLVGITSSIAVDSSIASRPVVCPGWNDIVWVKLKEFLVWQSVEIALVFDVIHVRPLRTIVADTATSTQAGWNIDNAEGALSVEIKYYPKSWQTQGEVYPLTTEEPQIIVAEAGETIEIVQELNASLTSVNQPVVQDWVDNQTYENTNGVYSVSGNDGLPITAAQWTAQGGSVSVRLGETPSQIIVTVVGADMPDYAPYRIAMSAGSNSFYNSLHITGTGVVWTEETLTITTGAGSDTINDEVYGPIESKYITTLTDAYNLGMRAAQAHTGVNYTINGSAVLLNRPSDNAELVAPTIADFNAYEGMGMQIATFNVEWAGQTFADFNDYFDSMVDDIWENQLFGNAPGSRIIQDDAAFRVITAVTTESSIQFTAKMDTMFADFNTSMDSMTIADFNVIHAGETFRQFNTVPLRNE